jgi:WD40 repeat protein
VLTLHTGSVEAITQDKTYLYSASADSTIAIWDKATWNVVNQLKGHTDGVGAITVDNDRIYSGGYDEAIKIWNKKDGKLVKTLQGHNGWIYNVIVQDNKIYSSSYDDTIRIWHVITGQTIQVLDRPAKPSRIRCLAVDGKTIYAGLKDYSIQTWTTVPGNNYIRTITKHTASVKAVAVDESQLYTASVDKFIYRWNKEVSADLLEVS